MPDDELDFLDELLDIIAPLIEEEDNDEYPLGDIQGCQDCSWNPDACDCGRYNEEGE